jgi:hypothetical protein
LLDHQSALPCVGPTASDPAAGVSFQVPSGVCENPNEYIISAIKSVIFFIIIIFLINKKQI